jgi:hypothetical protein
MTKALRRVDRAGSVAAGGKNGDKSDEPASEGKIVNLVAVDAFNISEMGFVIFMKPESNYPEPTCSTQFRSPLPSFWTFICSGER